MGDPPPELPDKWEREEQLDNGFDRLVLYEVLIEDQNGSFGYTFHPEFTRFLDYMIQETKNDPEQKALFRNVVEDVGDFGYTAAVLMPEYLAAVKIKKEIFARSHHHSEARLSMIINKAMDEKLAQNWSDEQLHENNIMAQIVHTKLVDDGKILSNLVE